MNKKLLNAIDGSKSMKVTFIGYKPIVYRLMMPRLSAINL